MEWVDGALVLVLIRCLQVFDEAVCNANHLLDKACEGPVHGVTALQDSVLMTACCNKQRYKASNRRRECARNRKKSHALFRHGLHRNEWGWLVCEQRSGGRAAGVRGLSACLRAAWPAVSRSTRRSACTPRMPGQCTHPITRGRKPEPSVATSARKNRANEQCAAQNRRV